MGNDAKRKWYTRKDMYGTTVYSPDTKQSEPGRGSVIENPASGLRVAYVYWPNAEEHADLIVRAVNTHDELVAACEKFSGSHDYHPDSGDSEAWVDPQDWAEFDAVVAKAKGANDEAR